jgi:hypothetical protein
MPRYLGPRKYAPLARYLAALPRDEVRLTLPEIEQIIGVPLPASARQPSFWTNRGTGLFGVRPWVWAGWRMARTHLRVVPPAVHFVRVEAMAGV